MRPVRGEHSAARRRRRAHRADARPLLPLLPAEHAERSDGITGWTGPERVRGRADDPLHPVILSDSIPRSTSFSTRRPHEDRYGHPAILVSN